LARWLGRRRESCVFRRVWSILSRCLLVTRWRTLCTILQLQNQIDPGWRRANLYFAPQMGEAEHVSFHYPCSRCRACKLECAVLIRQRYQAALAHRGANASARNGLAIGLYSAGLRPRHGRREQQPNQN